ncbi:hypothetical protein ABZ379_06830 [Streptomyces canus]|uniref:hypothetical protein n=1 Tax=Streptomyces canus TaxID=58343 RepID=UPI0033CB1A1D
MADGVNGHHQLAQQGSDVVLGQSVRPLPLEHLGQRGQQQTLALTAGVLVVRHIMLILLFAIAGG